MSPYEMVIMAYDKRGQRMFIKLAPGRLHRLTQWRVMLPLVDADA